jgi:hypothetical protein
VLDILCSDCGSYNILQQNEEAGQLFGRSVVLSVRAGRKPRVFSDVLFGASLHVSELQHIVAKSVAAAGGSVDTVPQAKQGGLLCSSGSRGYGFGCYFGLAVIYAAISSGVFAFDVSFGGQMCKFCACQKKKFIKGEFFYAESTIIS